MHLLKQESIPLKALLASVLLAVAFCNNVAAAGECRIMILSSGRTRAYAEAIQGLQAALDQQDAPVIYDVRYMEGDGDEAGELLRESVQKGRVKLVVTLGSTATATVLQAAPQAPVVAGMILKPEDFSSLRNTTGVFLDFPVRTQFEWIEKFLPEAKTIGVLYNPLQNEAAVAKARIVAREMGLTLVAKAVDTPDALPRAMKTLSREADVLWGVSDSVVLTPQTAKPILLFSFRNRIPFVGLSNVWVKAGALYSLDRDYVDIGRQCAELVVQILQGARVGAVAPVPPRTVLYSLNRKTADHMRVEIPERLLQNADEVF